jgi:hypothetical protein
VQKPLLLGLTTVAIALTATPTFSQSSSNNSISFGCETIENTPTTIAYTSENPNKQPMIYWKKEYIDSQNIVSDCERAAKILKNRYDKKEFRYLAFQPNSNNQTVVCLVNETVKTCEKSGEKLFLVSAVSTGQDLYKALLETIDPTLSQLDKETIEKQFRNADVTYSKMIPRSIQEILFNWRPR